MKEEGCDYLMMGLLQQYTLSPSGFLDGAVASPPPAMLDYPELSIYEAMDHKQLA